MCKKQKTDKVKAIDLSNRYYESTRIHCSVYMISSGHYNWIEKRNLPVGLEKNVVYDTEVGYL